MGMVIIDQSLYLPRTLCSSLCRFPLLPSQPRTYGGLFCRRRLKPCGIVAFRLNTWASRCSINTSVDFNRVVTEEQVLDDFQSISSGCSIPIVRLNSDILVDEPLTVVSDDTHISDLLTTLPVLSEDEQNALAAIPAHPAGLYALYAAFLAGNSVEQLWNFAWPAAVALLHPSLLPVAVVGFFTKFAIFVGGPLVGNLLDFFPRVPAFNFLNFVQAAAQLLSAAMIIYALSSARHTSALSMLLQPWFFILVLAGATERLTGLALGIAVERDWVVLLAGANRPIALAQANAVLCRIDLLCEIVGASLFGILLSRFDPVTCLKLAAGLIICTLPIVVFLVCLTNKLSAGVLDRYKLPFAHDKVFSISSLLNAGFSVGKIVNSIKHGWMEYKRQPVLPASLAYVLLYFNVVLAPGGIMTAFLTQRGINSSIIGGFSGLCAFMGVAATFISAGLVRQIGILKAGAAGLIFQASLLVVAVSVYWTGILYQKIPIRFFLCLIVLSRLGHMSYDVVGAQILQTGIPTDKANLIATTEVSMASLAEFFMLGVTIIANDASHFGFLALLSVSSVVAATWMFCRWLTNPTEKQKELFSFDPQF